MTAASGRHIGRAQARAIPDGWRMVAKGLWEHENGTRVDFTGHTGERRYLAADADGVEAYAASRAEAFAWAEGRRPDMVEVNAARRGQTHENYLAAIRALSVATAAEITKKAGYARSHTAKVLPRLVRLGLVVRYPATRAGRTPYLYEVAP